MIYQDYIRVLYIDLEKRQIKTDDRIDLKKYLGGVGVATVLLDENVKAKSDPLDPAQPIIFSCGVLSNIYPVVTKTVAMFRSPLTGELGESYAGGRLATTMFLSGYDAIVITGKSAAPVYLSIDEKEIRFNDARTLWGIDIDETGRLIRERESGSGKRSIIRIGPAGENLVPFSCVNVDTYRHFGRLGLGAVMGSKKLKGICIKGGRSVPSRDFNRYFKAYREIYDKTVNTELMAKYHDLGTPINIAPLNDVSALPTENMRKSKFDGVKGITGEAFAMEHLVRKVACTGCPVGCIHIGMYRNQFDHGYEFESISVAYDYELIYALGSSLGISSSKDVLRLIKVVEDEGVDAMSCGICLAWAAECFERGLISEKETIVPLKFGEVDGFLKGIGYIARKENEFYSILGKGTKTASKKYGGEEFAMHLGGNEMPGYHTGYGSLIGPAVGARHSHLCNAGYSVDQGMKDYDEDKLVDEILKEEIERCMLNCLTICLFARKIYTRDTIIKALSGIGIEKTSEDLNELGREIYRTKLHIKKRLGFRQNQLKFPKRFFKTPSAHGVLNEEVAYRLMDKYQERAAEVLSSDREELF